MSTAGPGRSSSSAGSWGSSSSWPAGGRPSTSPRPATSGGSSSPFAGTSWIPLWLLWTIGLAIPLVELLAGGLICLGLRVRAAGIALGCILLVVTYGHLLEDALYDTTHHIFPRLVLLTFVLAAPAERDLLSLDAWLRRRTGGERGNIES